MLMSITILPPIAGANELWYLFISGMIAICAMILPGISGSFILLLLGSYATVIEAIKDKELLILGVFSGGCIIGLFSFSRLLKWLFSKYHDITIALLTGFLVGSLNKLWPWKETISYQMKSDGSKLPLIQEPIWPQSYLQITGQEPNIIAAISIAVGGVLIVLGLDWASRRFEDS